MSTTTTPSLPDYTSELEQIASSLQAIQSLFVGASPRTSLNDGLLSGRQFRVDGTRYAPVVPVAQAKGALPVSRHA